MKAANRYGIATRRLGPHCRRTLSIITNRLGWLSVIDYDAEYAGGAGLRCAGRERNSGYRPAVVPGHGRPNSLARGRVQSRYSHVRAPACAWHVARIQLIPSRREVEQQLDLSKNLFIVSANSGGTVGGQLVYKYFRAKIDVFAADAAGQHFIAITDEGRLAARRWPRWKASVKSSSTPILAGDTRRCHTSPGARRAGRGSMSQAAAAAQSQHGLTGPVGQRVSSPGHMAGCAPGRAGAGLGTRFTLSPFTRHVSHLCDWSNS